VREKIREFIMANVNVDEDTVVKDDDNIFRLGYVSSLFAMRLLNFIEASFAITVDDEDIALVNFSTIDAMAKLVGKYRTDR